MNNIKLSKETQQLISEIVTVGQKFNIDVFTLDGTGIRAKSDEKFIFLYKSEINEDLEFDSLCVNRINEFNKRISLINEISNGSYTMEIVSTKEMKSGGTLALKLGVRAKNTYIEIGCAEASQYKMFSEVKDTPLVNFNVDADGIRIIKGFGTALRNKNKTINIKAINGIITVNARDIEGDSATGIICTNPTFETDEEEFSFIYKVNNLLPLLMNDDVSITITSKGLLTSVINGITVIILSEGSE